jgi:very-short-patch-repair endonuclease
MTHKELKIQVGSNSGSPSANELEVNSPLEDGGSNMFYGALPIHFEFARELRNNPTKAESFLWDHLHIIKGIRFKRQHPILYFIADFYCHKAKLIVEVDGEYHNIPEQYLYDKNRDNELNELGLKVIRFTNEQVLFEIEKTLYEIEQKVKERIHNLRR